MELLGGNVKPPDNVEPAAVVNVGNVGPNIIIRLKLQEQTKDIKIRTLK